MNKRYKLKLFAKLRKNMGHSVCYICLERNPGKNMFAKLRRGTC